MKIAIVAPSFGQIGGPEIFTQNLANELSKKGIDVVLFAPGDWQTLIKHIPTIEESLWNMKNFKKQSKKERVDLRITSQIKVLDYEKEFDLIHLNSQKYACMVAEKSKKPIILTLHNKIKSESLGPIRLAKIYTVAATKSQKNRLQITKVINHGFPVNEIDFSTKKGKYLIFIGRITDQKGVDTAVQIAIKAKKKLIIIGRIGNSSARQEYFLTKIKPFIDNKIIIFKGEVPHNKVYQYLKNAEAILFPIRRPETFGMVCAEALACGTPIIGTIINPLPELFLNNKVAFLSNDFDELVNAAKNTDQFDRQACRDYACKNFDSSKMADEYIKLYKKILNKKK